MGSERRKCFALMGLTAPTNQSIDNCPIPSLETCNKIRRRLFLFFQMLESFFPPLHWALSNPKGLRGPMINYTRNRNNKNNMLACHSFLLPLGGEAKAIYLTTWCLREDRFTHGSLCIMFRNYPPRHISADYHNSTVSISYIFKCYVKCIRTFVQQKFINLACIKNRA